MKSRITIARKRIIIISLILIIVCVLVMLIPKDTAKDTGIVEEGVEISEPTVPNQEPIIKEEGAITPSALIMAAAQIHLTARRSSRP